MNKSDSFFNQYWGGFVGAGVGILLIMVLVINGTAKNEKIRRQHIADHESQMAAAQREIDHAEELRRNPPKLLEMPKREIVIPPPVSRITDFHVNRTTDSDTSSDISEGRRGWSKTKSGYIAAVSKEMLDKAISYRAAGDRAAFNKLLVTGAIMEIEGGKNVEIVDFKLFSGMIKIRAVGDTDEVWTVREAVK